MERKLIRAFCMIISLILITGIFGGCGEKDKSPSSDKGDSGKNEKEIEFLVDPEEYRGTKVTYVTWKDPENNEDGPVVKAFEEKYGIDVEVQLVSEGNYVNAIAASIASNQQGDIFFENGAFPGSLTVMQPLDAAKINFDDPIWRQDTIKISTLDGHPYLVDTVSNVWAETDICVYNKKIFEENNINSPADYYEAGKWTFEAFRECAKQVSALGKDFLGAEIISEAALGAAGCTNFVYKDNQMSLAVDEHFHEVMNFLAQMNADGYCGLGRFGFADGKVGMALTNCFALKKTGYFAGINPDLLGFTYLPTWKEGSESYTTGIYRGWGLIKGAKNPVAAGIFLREYLDVNNYDLDLTFQSEEAANFFFKVTADQPENTIYYRSADMVVSTGIGERYCDHWSSNSPAQIRGFIESKLNIMQSMCNKANDIIATERAWLKENYK